MARNNSKSAFFNEGYRLASYDVKVGRLLPLGKIPPFAIGDSWQKKARAEGYSKRRLEALQISDSVEQTKSTEPTFALGIKPGDIVLVTCNQWFYGPGGRAYRGVQGTVHGIYSDAETLGLKTNARSANWYMRVGDVVVAGCQVFYVVKLETNDELPATVPDYDVVNGEIKPYQRPANVYRTLA